MKVTLALAAAGGSAVAGAARPLGGPATYCTGTAAASAAAAAAANVGSAMVQDAPTNEADAPPGTSRSMLGLKRIGWTRISIGEPAV
mmetsp:Transcript_37166/g.80919  ORF Transcript_37166/g.80919 Transcript_37166/m.80919 type:complete len:87 (-) Transcript_37166:394-654(-)